MRDNTVSFEILEDLGSFGDDKWQKHLTKIKWGNNEPTYDLRAWNEDMTRMGKGITLSDADLFDLFSLLEDKYS